MRDDCDASRQEVQLELPQPPGSFAVGMRDQRAHGHTASDRFRERPPQVGSVEAEHHDIYRLAGMPDGRKERRHAVVWLHNQLHARPPAASRGVESPHRLARAPSIRPFARRAHLSTPRAPRATDAMLGDNGSCADEAECIRLAGASPAGRPHRPGCSPTRPAPRTSAPRQARSVSSASGRAPTWRCERSSRRGWPRSRGRHLGTDHPAPGAARRGRSCGAQGRAARRHLHAPGRSAVPDESSGGTCRRATSATRSPRCRKCPLALPLRVNTPWPADAPRATVPPQLLSSLYPLPEGLEYRFLDRHLVLLDGEANLVVDYILDVVPTVVRGRH